MSVHASAGFRHFCALQYRNITMACKPFNKCNANCMLCCGIVHYCTQVYFVNIIVTLAFTLTESGSSYKKMQHIFIYNIAHAQNMYTNSVIT